MPVGCWGNRKPQVAPTPPSPLLSPSSMSEADRPGMGGSMALESEMWLKAEQMKALPSVNKLF